MKLAPVFLWLICVEIGLLWRFAFFRRQFGNVLNFYSLQAGLKAKAILKEHVDDAVEFVKLSPHLELLLLKNQVAWVFAKAKHRGVVVGLTYNLLKLAIEFLLLLVGVPYLSNFNGLQGECRFFLLLFLGFLVKGEAVLSWLLLPVRVFVAWISHLVDYVVMGDPWRLVFVDELYMLSRWLEVQDTIRSHFLHRCLSEKFFVQIVVLKLLLDDLG